MQESLENNNILMYSSYNDSRSVMTANNSKSQLPYLNKLVEQYSNTYHHYINKKPINTDYSTWTEKRETTPRTHKFKINDIVRITKYKNIFSKVYTQNWSR